MCLVTRSKLQRDQDRDVSELIALGVPNPRTTSEAQYDQRLFNHSRVSRVPPAGHLKSCSSFPTTEHMAVEHGVLV